MRRVVRPGTILFLILGLTACSLRPRDPDAEVREAVRAYFQALNEADPTAIMEMFSRNPEVTSSVEGEIIRGWEAIRIETDKIAGTGGERKWAPGTMEVLSLGAGHALVVIPVNITLTSGLGREDLAGATTLVLEKKAGHWKILHEHHSLQPSGSDGDWDSSRG